ncbi:MAG: ABC transporter ATP-binding protein [Parvibaculaceae bacterium]
MTKTETILSLRGVTRTFGAKTAVKDVTLDIREGELFTIVGPSGSGKSTLIRMLAGLETPSSGDILLRGARINDMPANRRPTCMVFQSLALFNHMTVGENIEFALTVRGADRKARRERARELMALVRLPPDFYGKSVLRCSGGERQRVALARALASDPDILFFDEPLSAIDYRLRKILEMEMKDLNRETGKTFVYITHSLEEAMVMSDRIAVMRDGEIVQLGDPLAIYNAPATRFVAEFMGQVNLLPVTADSDGSRVIEGIGVPVAPGFTAAPRLWIMLRPERLRLLGKGRHADVEFEAVCFNTYLLGSRTHVHLRRDERTFIVELAPDVVLPQPGAKVRIGFDWVDAVSVEGEAP